MNADSDGRSLRRAHMALLALNGIGAATAAGFAAAGLLQAGSLDTGAPPTTEPNAAARFWAASSAVRTWALAVPLLVSLARPDPASPGLLCVAGLVQLGDSALGIQLGNRRMTVAPAAMGTVHLLTALTLFRARATRAAAGSRHQASGLLRAGTDGPAT